MRTDRVEWPTRERWIDLAWVLFSIANLAAMALLPDWETVPFHFIWVSLTLLYGFRVWRVRPTFAVLAVVMVTTAAMIGLDVARKAQPIDEITEVPLMAAMFVAMVWHARRRLVATEEAERVSMENLRLLERERRFVQDASHELRTPITVALGYAEAIQRADASPEIVADAAVITDELSRLRRLADRLLLLAGSEDPAFLHRRPVDLETLVVDATHRWITSPRRWRLGTIEEAVVLVDEDRLALAVDALIENAVHHTQADDAIELSVRRRGDLALLAVTDTGSGIPAEALARLFDRFARADPGRSRDTGGFGLGLAIVKAIVQAHGGTVGVESHEGTGSTFTIALPVLAAGRADDRTPAGVSLRAVDDGARDLAE